MIVPTRSRPASVARLVKAWRDTGAFDDAELLLAADRDDPQWAAYAAAVAAVPPVTMVTASRWQPMVHKLDSVALGVAWGADDEVAPPPFAVGFAGDDHVPRSHGWTAACVGALREMGTGIVWGADGYQDDNIPTWWVMTCDIVRALGRMVPAPVEHLYCDNAMKDLGERAGCWRYLPDVLVEHMNPYAGGKADMDAQYRRVNSQAQFQRDGAAYVRWKRRMLGLQAAEVRTLISPH